MNDKSTFYLMIDLLLSMSLIMTSGEPVARISSSLFYNAYLNQHVSGMFTCLVEKPASARWIIDGHQADSATIIQRGITISYNLTAIPDRVVATVSIPATTANTNGVIGKCRAYTTSIQYVESSETALFKVQGLLQLFPNVTVTSFNKSHNMVTWEEPFTLNITDVEPDIFGYTLCTSPAGSLTTECRNMTRNTALLSKYFLTLHLTISAWNIVGQSNTVEYEVNPCRSSSGGFDAVAHVSFRNDQTIVNFALLPNTTSADVCLAMFFVEIYDEGRLSASKTTLYSYQNSILVQLNLLENRKYTANVRISEEHSVVYQTSFSEFSTFDVQNVAVVIQEHGVTVTCWFALGTTTRGFIVEVMSGNDTIVVRQVSLSQDCTEDSGSCLQNTTFSIAELESPSNYTISVYDWEKDGAINRVYTEELIIKRTPQIVFPLTTTSSNISMESTTSIFNDSVLTIQLEWSAVTGGSAGVIILTCLIVLLLLVVFVKKKRCRKANLQLRSTDASVQSDIKHNRLEAKCQPNDAYALVLQMNNNEAYHRVHSHHNNNTTEVPHVYDDVVIVTPQETPTEPTYAEIQF